MAFSWLEYEPPTWYQETFPEKRAKMFREEVGRRARILKYLRHDVEEAKVRICAALEWEYELHDRPDWLDEAEGIVEEVYEKVTI